MQKKIIAIIFLVLILSGIIFYLFNFRKIKQPVSSAIRAIPTNAGFIIESNQSHNLWKKLSEANIMWDELLQTEFILNLNEQLKIFDSFYILKPEVKEIFDKHSLFISAHKTSEREINFLFIFSVPLSANSKIIPDLAEEIAKTHGFFKTEKEYDGASISQYSSSDSVFSFTVYDNIFIGSFDPMLVEDAVRQVNSGASLMDDFGFSSMLATAGENSDANLFVNYKFFPEWLSLFSKKDISENILSLRNFADWSAFDLRLKPNILMLNGFTFSNDTLKKFLALFENQKPQDAEFFKIIPYNTIAFLHLGFSNFNEFYKEYQLFIDTKERSGKIKLMNAECNCNIEKSFLGWIENEMAIVFTESSNEQPYCFAVFKSNNISEAEKILSEATDSIKEIKMDSALLNYQIRKIKQTGAYPVLLGNLFEKPDNNYFIIVDDYVVFSNEIQSLKNLISNYLAEKTLSKNLNFHSFSEELSSESNVFFYGNLSRSAKILNEFMHPDYFKKIEMHSELLKKFESFAMQFSSDKNNLFYSDVILKYNPSSKNETATLWETRLDTTISFKPALVTNHYTQAKEIFVQDDANNIYLISNTGKILWKRNIAEKIMSEIYQIDVLNNNKLQLLFNTTSAIYLVDRNGKDVQGFPVKLQASATNGISVFDYEKNKNYRIALACNDGSVYNYEKTGKVVTGWDFPKVKNTLRLPVQHFNLNGKDYLVAVDDGGNIYCVDRSGKTRISLKEKIPVSKNNNFFIEPGKDIGKTRIVSTDSIGNIMRVYFGGNVENIKIDDFSDNHFFAYLNINEDQSSEYVFLDNRKLQAYSQEKIRYSIFDFQFESDIIQAPAFFEFPDHSKKIGIADGEANKIYLMDETGRLQNNFPLYGNTLFSIGDLNNDGTLYLVTGSGKNIYTYLLK